ncbi:hypothetical protein J6590_031891 [Homalodisca vitripennis]|nr:hypothetical protein J6590_031891 [Homalodisca vitripennis]
MICAVSSASSSPVCDHRTLISTIDLVLYRLSYKFCLIRCSHRLVAHADGQNKGLKRWEEPFVCDIRRKEKRRVNSLGLSLALTSWWGGGERRIQDLRTKTSLNGEWTAVLLVRTGSQTTLQPPKARSDGQNVSSLPEDQLILPRNHFHSHAAWARKGDSCDVPYTPFVRVIDPPKRDPFNSHIGALFRAIQMSG